MRPSSETVTRDCPGELRTVGSFDALKYYRPVGHCSSPGLYVANDRLGRRRRKLDGPRSRKPLAAGGRWGGSRHKGWVKQRVSSCAVPQSSGFNRYSKVTQTAAIHPDGRLRWDVRSSPRQPQSAPVVACDGMPKGHPDSRYQSWRPPGSGIRQKSGFNERINRLKALTPTPTAARIRHLFQYCFGVTHVRCHRHRRKTVQGNQG